MKSSITLTRFCFVFFYLLNITCLKAQYPSEEIRAVWLTTNWNLDWPSSPNISSERQKQELSEILDKLSQANFNTILFQVRIRGDVFYDSKIESKSPFFRKKNEVGSNTYDPLEFVIAECHKRGLECHAWFVTFPLGTKKQVLSQGQSSIVKKQPKICLMHQGEWYLDPGNPKTTEYLLSLVNEIVINYDIDGIHLDYIRYPENTKKFPDNESFKLYGRGQNLQSWRRENINQLVEKIYTQVKEKKPWVQVSASPLGRYQNLDYFGKGTWNAYESVHQDAGKWMKDGYLDAVYPMMYYNETSFHQYVADWLKNSNGRFVTPGLGAYRLETKEGNWPLIDIISQIDSTRSVKANGQTFYRAGNILKNTKGILSSLKQNYYEYPAKLPPMIWIKNYSPNRPIDIQVYRNDNGLVTIEWNNDSVEDLTYTLYESSNKIFNLNDVKKIVRTRIHGTKIYLKTNDIEEGVYYTLTASDRFHNESSPSTPAFFILSSTLEK